MDEDFGFSPYRKMIEDCAAHWNTAIDTINNNITISKIAKPFHSLLHTDPDKLLNMLFKNQITMGGNKMIPDVSKALTPKKIIHNGPATIVFWKDGTKTIVRINDYDNDNPYYALVSALAKKVFGNNSKVNKIVSMTEFPEEKKSKGKQKGVSEN